MIPALIFCSKDSGIMEYLNDGSFEKPSIPAFHYSRFPKRLGPTNPLGMTTRGYLKDCFWTRVLNSMLL